MGNQRIRAAEPDDVPALSCLAKRTWSDAFGDGVSLEDEQAELEAGRSETYFARALKEKTILVAEENGLLLGYLEIGEVTISEVDRQPGDQSLNRLYVETAAQGQGLGRRLLEAGLRHPRLAHASRIYLTVWDENERAVRLYETVGFRRVGRTRFRIGSEVVEDLVMLLDKTAAEDTQSPTRTDA